MVQDAEKYKSEDEEVLPYPCVSNHCTMFGHHACSWGSCLASGKVVSCMRLSWVTGESCAGLAACLSSHPCSRSLRSRVQISPRTPQSAHLVGVVCPREPSMHGGQIQVYQGQMWNLRMAAAGHAEGGGQERFGELRLPAAQHHPRREGALLSQLVSGQSTAVTCGKPSPLHEPVSAHLPPHRVT